MGESAVPADRTHDRLARPLSLPKGERLEGERLASRFGSGEKSIVAPEPISLARQAFSLAISSCSAWVLLGSVGTVGRWPPAAPWFRTAGAGVGSGRAGETDRRNANKKGDIKERFMLDT